MKACERHFSFVLLAAWLYCGYWTLDCAHANAQETLEPRPIETAANSKNDIDEIPVLKPAIQVPKVYPPLPDDAIYDIVRRWREAETKINANAAFGVTYRGESPAGKTPDWRVPEEEEAVLLARTLAPFSSGAEPEVARFGGDDEAADRVVAQVLSDAKVAVRTPTEVNAKASVKTVVNQKFHAVDPEAGRFIDSADSADNLATIITLPEAPIASSARPTVPADLKATPALVDDSPRIASGSGLDKDDPKPAPAAALQPAPAEITNDIAAPVASLTAKIPVAAAPAATHKWTVQDTLNDPKSDPKAVAKTDPKPSAKADPKAKAKASGAAGKSADPEERTAQLLKEILEKQKQFDDLMHQANARLKPIVNPQSGMTIRNEQERKVFGTLTDAKRPLGAVAVKIFDPKTKLPLAGRVCLRDTTDAAARAPLASGFYCRGVTPPINVVSGLVRAEISHGGRFFPTLVKGLEVIAGQVLPLDVPMSRPPELDFAAHGWIMADLDIGIRKQPGENTVWFGAPPTVNDLILGAKAEGVRVVGVTIPLGDENAVNQLQNALAKQNPDVLLIPVFPGPRNLFNGAGSGFGVTSWEGLKATSAMPEVPLREAFDGIRARGGLAVIKSLSGVRTASIEREILPYYGRLKDSHFFDGNTSTQAHMYGAAELPFDTVTGAYDVLAFDGSDDMEAVWFNLLNENAPVRVIGAGGGSLEGGRIPFGQTFLQVDGKPTREKVMQSISEGRSMVSFGPAAFCKVYERDMGPGSVLPTDGRALNFQIRAYSTLTSGAQLDKVEIIRNGKVVYTQTAADGESEIQDLRWPMTETANAWYVVRVTERIGRDSANNTVSYRRAWTSPIFFRNNAASIPDVCISHIHGVLRKGLTPMRGVVTALATGMPTQRVESAADGSYSIALPATGTLIFEAADCEPVARRIFEHPQIQNGIGKLMAAEDIMRKLADRPIFGLWRLLLSDLDWDVTLQPCAPPPEPPRIPEAQ